MKITKLSYALFIPALLTGCYDEQEGLDHDVNLPDVSIVIPQTAYSGSLGDQINITPIINTTIDEADLSYHWEVQGEQTNSYNRKTFSSLVDPASQGRTLSYTCHLDSVITQLSRSYPLRLRVHQESTGRDFYSDTDCTITIEGITGLLVLHGDDATSEIGLLKGDEFMPQSSAIPESPSATAALYSINAGDRLPGKGKSIVQICVEEIEWYGDEAKNNCRIVAATDKETVILERGDLSLWGKWNDLFYLQGDRKVNDDDPQGYFSAGSNAYAFDGDQLFVTQPTSVFQYLLPTVTADHECKDGNMVTLAPAVCNFNSGSGFQTLLYAKTINGDTSKKGFVGTTSYYRNFTNDMQVIDTRNDAVSFNPGDMDADLVYMTSDSRSHVLAMMKGSQTNRFNPGGYFLVDLYPHAPAGGESAFINVPAGVWSMAAQADADKAQWFEFGSTQNMCYYATPSTLYHYGIDGTTLTTASPLVKTDGSSLTISGTITMMKKLASPEVTTHYDDEVLLVATWDGTVSHLYALHLDAMTGNVLNEVVYGPENVGGWNFGKIYDVNIKSL